MTCQDQGVVERGRRRVSGFERSNKRRERVARAERKYLSSMPNTEVKLSSAEDSWQDACENRTLLGSFFYLANKKVKRYLASPFLRERAEIKKPMGTHQLIEISSTCFDHCSRLSFVSGQTINPVSSHKSKKSCECWLKLTRTACTPEA